MPNMADIVIKKADNVTNVTYSAVTPSAGDRSPAVWRSNSSATLRGNRATLSLDARSNGTGTARRVHAAARFHVVRTIDGVEVIAHTVPMELTAVIPEGLTDAEVSEAVEQEINLLSSVLVRQSIAIGYAPV